MGSRNEIRQFMLVKGGGAEEALVEVAAPAGEQRQLVFGLDALGDDLEVKLARQADHRPDDDAVAAAVDQVDDQAAVNLQRVERQAGQPGHAGIAGAEIVDRDLHAGVPQTVKAFGGAWPIDEKAAFGNLNGYPAGIEAGGGDLLQQPIVIAVAGKIIGQQVDRQLEIGQRR